MVPELNTKTWPRALATDDLKVAGLCLEQHLFSNGETDHGNWTVNLRITNAAEAPDWRS